MRGYPDAGVRVYVGMKTLQLVEWLTALSISNCWLFATSWEARFEVRT